MGNICRSPAAEGIFKKFVQDKKLGNVITVDSAGTIGYHDGELPDARMRKLASKFNYILDSRARKFNPNYDFEEYDYIVTMDDNNYYDVLQSDTNNKYLKNIFKMADFINDPDISEVPDPYYGGDKDFIQVIELLEKGAENLLKKIEDDIERDNKK